MARRTPGSSGWKKAKANVAACSRYGTQVRQEFAHQTSHALVAEATTRLIVFEALGIARMTRRPKARQDEQGHWRRNGARAKSGLNKSILASAWGKTQCYAHYKALRAGKLAITVPAHHSSQECALCGHTHPDNRPSQAVFVCQRCGHTDHADHNAACVIKQRGVAKLVSGELAMSPRRKTMRLTKTVGPERSEPVPCAPTPVEITVSRESSHGSLPRRSLKPETLATVE